MEKKNLLIAGVVMAAAVAALVAYQHFQTPAAPAQVQAPASPPPADPYSAYTAPAK